MKKYTRTNKLANRRKLQPRTKDEQRLLNAVLNLYNKSIRSATKKKKIETVEDFIEVLDKIDIKKIEPTIRRYTNSLLSKNRGGFLNIMSAMFNTKKGIADRTKLEKQFAKALPSLIQEKRIYKPYMDKFVENMSLIKNISGNVVKELQKAYEKGEGLRGTEAEKILKEQLGRRAKLIIRTESSKINAALTETRAKSLGIKAYIWSTSTDQRVRPSHKMMDGVLVFWNDAPTLDKMGPAHAGEYPNCRCISLPVFELDDIKFPIKVAHNLEIESTYIKGSGGKYNAKIVKGNIIKYSKEQFIKKFKI